MHLSNLHQIHRFCLPIATVYKTNEIINILMFSDRTWTAPRCSRVAIRTVFPVEKQQIAKSNVGSHFFDYRCSFLDSGDQIFERQHDFLVDVQ